jgi:predicted transposase YbfD/YdcC
MLNFPESTLERDLLALCFKEAQRIKMRQYTKAKALLASLKSIPDYRVDEGKIQYPLHEVLFMVLFALLKGNTTFKDIWGWMVHNEHNPILKEIFEKKKLSIPARSTLHNMLINTDNNALESVFRDYFSHYVKQEEIAIDGKWLNGSDANGQYVEACHKAVLNILDKNKRIVFAHKFLSKNKKNEITALKEAFDEDLFSDEGQIFSFDAIQTQAETLNRLDAQGDKYIAKVKGNQKGLQQKIVATIEDLKEPMDRYIQEEPELSHGKKYVTREIEIFYTPSMKQVLCHEKFQNIQSLVRIKKRLYDPVTKKETFYTDYLMANFRTSARDFHEKIRAHWCVETYHYHLDMLFDEDDHIAYKDPFSIAILRSFALNLLQIFFNANKEKKVLPTGKTTMAEIKRTCRHDDLFTSRLFEQEYCA